MRDVVYVVLHYDQQGCENLIAVFATREAAEDARVTRTRTGNRSQAYDAHNEQCCEVMEKDVHE